MFRLNRKQRAPLHIAILSFNRPHYLGEVLSSLVPQLSRKDKVYLFQDGGWNPHSGTQKAPSSVIEECFRVFSKTIPQGGIFASPVNLGCAGNFRRVEDYIFGELQAPHAVMLEDDMILSKDYLDVLEQLLQIALVKPSIGYVTAYGDFWASLEEQKNNEGQLRAMHENWGCAMTRASWLQQKPIREQYWKFVENCDYTLRDHDAIRKFHADLGYKISISGQDGSRWVACAEAKLARVTTKTCHARYIGRIGIHSDADQYDKYKFKDSVWYPHCPKINPPSDSEIEGWINQEKEKLLNGYRHAYTIDA